MADYLPSVVTLIGGFLLGWFSHRLTRSREVESRKHATEAAKATRKQQLLNFLVKWHAEIKTDHVFNLVMNYPGKVQLLRAEAAAVCNDFVAGTKRKTFVKLVNMVSSFTNDQIANHPSKKPQDVIGEPLDALIEFVILNRS